jgi:DNA-binding NarL/FixJ family response regulator
MTQSSRIKILIAHGDPLVAAGLAVSLQKQPDFEAYVWPASNQSSATASDLSRPDVVVADYDSGMRLIASAAAGSHRVVILTHSDGEARIRDALEQGARGYLLLGCSLRDLFDALRSVRAGGLAIGPLVAARVAEWMTQRALTRREGDILRQMMLGRSNKHIAMALNVAIGTVKTHVKVPHRHRTLRESVLARAGRCRAATRNGHLRGSGLRRLSAALGNNLLHVGSRFRH